MNEYWRWINEFKRSTKEEWAELWKSKYVDSRNAEGISSKDYNRLFVRRGEVIYATRKFKPLSFRDILEKHLGAEGAAKIDIDPKVGGWGRFSRTHFPAKSPKNEKQNVLSGTSQHQRKGGAGWLNKMHSQRRR